METMIIRKKKLIKMIKGDHSSNDEKLSFFLVGEMTVATMKNNNYRTKDLFLFDRHPKLFTDMNINRGIGYKKIQLDWILLCPHQCMSSGSGFR